MASDSLLRRVGGAVAALAIGQHAAAQASAAPSRQPDLLAGCYSPTQHLTEALRRSFVEERRPIAARAEGDHGVPAPILAAMAIVESGYGTTRLAIDTHNLLSFKWPSDAGPGGRPVYRLACQPPENRENRYVRFASRAEAMDFVASRFRASSYYRVATAHYQADLAAGTGREEAARRWLQAIAAAYNPYYTDRYIARILLAADDPLDLRGPRNPYTTLWTLAR